MSGSEISFDIWFMFCNNNNQIIYQSNAQKSSYVYLENVTLLGYVIREQKHNYGPEEPR